MEYLWTECSSNSSSHKSYQLPAMVPKCMLKIRTGSYIRTADSVYFSNHYVNVSVAESFSLIFHKNNR